MSTAERTQQPLSGVIPSPANFPITWEFRRVRAAPSFRWNEAIAVAIHGGPPPEQVIARQPACQIADPASITAVVAGVAGYFTHQAMQPPRPGLPTVRAFAAQRVVAREWLSHHTGWR